MPGKPTKKIAKRVSRGTVKKTARKASGKAAKKATKKSARAGTGKAGAAAGPKTAKPESVEGYLAALPEERRAAIQAVREVILANLDKDYEEGIQYGMIGYYVPHRVYPDGYHCDPRQPLPYVSIASQKNHMAIYMMCIYADEALRAWFEEAWRKAGKKLDMGKGCVRFKSIEDVPLKVVGQAIRKMPAKKLIARYEATVKTSGKRGR